MALVALAGGGTPANALTESTQVVPAIDNVRISPAGDQILAVSARGQRRVLIVTDIVTGKSLLAVQPSRTQSLDACRWVSDRRIVCSLFVSPETGPPWRSKRRLRLIALDPDGTDVVPIFPRPPKAAPKVAGVVPMPGGRSPRPWYEDFEHYVVDPWISDAEHLLVAADREAIPYPSLYRVNSDTGRARRVSRWQAGIQFWHTDLTGRLRAGTGWFEFGDDLPSVLGRRPKEPHVGPTAVVFAGSFERLSIERVSGRNGSGPTIPEVLGFDADGRRVYMAARVDGADRTAIWEADSRTFEPLRRLVTDPTRDVSARIIAGSGCGTVGFMHRLPGRPFTWLDKQFGADIDLAQQSLTDSVVAVTSMSRDCRYVTIATSDDRSRRSFFLLDRSTGRIRPLGEQYPGVASQSTARRDYTWIARDGVALPMSVTTPTTDEASGLVVLVHNSMAIDSVAPLDLWPHHLAERGYVVAEPGFRGASGLGAKLRLAGLEKHGRKLREDIADSVAWLADRGIADPRVCYIGRGVGGHLALAAALPGIPARPEQLLCVAVLAPVNPRGTTRHLAAGRDHALMAWARPDSRSEGATLISPLHVVDHTIASSAAVESSTFRSPLRDADHPGFPVLVYGRRPALHERDTRAWRADLEALGSFSWVTPRGSVPETRFLDHAIGLLDQVIEGRPTLREPTDIVQSRRSEAKTANAPP